MSVDGHAVDQRALSGVVLRRVLAVLALEKRAVPRDELGDAVWGEALPRTWETALRGAVHQLRRAVASVDPDGDAGADAIRTAFGCYQLDAAIRVDVVDAMADVEEAERALAAGDAEVARATAQRSAAVLAEPLLAGLDGEWLDAQRRRLAPYRARALLALSAASTACGDHEAAVDAATAAVDVDPFDERAHRRLMTAHAGAGERAAALVAYRRCRSLLIDELGVDPSEQTEAVRRSIAQASTPIVPIALPRSLDTRLRLAARAEELAVLERAWTAARDGAGSVVAVSGAAGAGKSRLAAEVAMLAHRDGGTVTHGRFDFDDLGVFGAFAEVLGQLGVAWPPPDATDGASPERGRLFGRARDALRAAASGGGLLVILDDAHWADRPSLALLADLAAAPVTGVLVVVTARDDWVPPALAEVLELVDRVDLATLDMSGTSELIAAWAGHGLAGDAVEHIHRRTAGNPFFVTAVLQDLADRGVVDLASGVAGVEDVEALPATVAGLVAAAVARCGPRADRVALGAAVLGDEFRPDVLAALTGEPAGVIAATLERLVHVRVLGRSTQDDSRFRFVHALVRQSLVDRAPADDLRTTHRAAAAALEELAPGSPDLFGHFLAADDPDAGERLVELGLLTAGDLNDRGAPDEAAAMLESLLDRLGETAPESTRASVLMALATAEFSLDRLAEGRRHLRDAAGLAVASGDPTCLRTGMVLLRPPTSAEYDPASIEAASGLLALAEPGSRLEASAQCWLSSEMGATDVDRSVELAEAALDTARRLQNPELIRLASLTWHLMARATTDPVERRQVLEAMLQQPGSVGRGPTDISAWVFLAGDHLEVGDRAGAERAVTTALAATTGFGGTHLRWLALRNQVMLAVLDDDLDRADELLVEATSVASALPIPEAVTLPVLQQVLTRYHQRRLDELQPLVAAFDAIAPPGGPVPIVRGFIEAELGHPDAAESVDRAVATAFAQPRTAGWVGLTAVTVEAAAAVGHERTAELAALLEPRSGQHAVIVTIGYLGAIDRYLGLAAGAAGDLARARQLLHRAQEQHRLIGAGAYLDRTAADISAIESAA